MVRRELFLHDLDRRVRRILLDALDAVQAADLRGIALAHRDDLPVLRLQAEAELARLVLIDLKLRMGGLHEALYRLILHRGDGRVDLDAVDTLESRALALVHLGGRDDLAISGLQVKLDAGGYLSHEKLSHIVLSFRFIHGTL